MNIRTTLAAVFAALLAGCVSAPQTPIDLTDGAIDAKAGRVGVAMTPLPKIDTQILGAACLLCVAAATVANASLTEHLQTLPYEDLPRLKNEVADALRKKGVDVIVVPDAINVDALSAPSSQGPNVAKKDFSPLRQKYQVDKLIVIQVDALGARRSYAAYIPTSDPKAVFAGSGYMVNLSNNTYEWYLPIDITKSADGAWDEPPKYPGMTNAYFQALELGKDSVLAPFKKGSTAGVVREVPKRPAEQVAKLNAPPIADKPTLAISRNTHGLPGAGAMWKYSYREQQFGSRDLVFTVRVLSVDDWLVNESYSVDGGDTATAIVDARQPNYVTHPLPRSQTLLELSPYILAANQGALPPGFRAPETYPLARISDYWTIKTLVQSEQVSVPAGNFKTVRVEVEGTCNTERALTATRFRYRAWYAPEVGRYVMVQHEASSPLGGVLLNETVKLVEYRSN